MGRGRVYVRLSCADLRSPLLPALITAQVNAGLSANKDLGDGLDVAPRDGVVTLLGIAATAAAKGPYR